MFVGIYSPEGQMFEVSPKKANELLAKGWTKERKGAKPKAVKKSAKKLEKPKDEAKGEAGLPSIDELD